MKTLLVIGVVLSILIVGLTLKGSLLTSEKEVMNEPVVELTSEQKFEEARNQILKEIKDLESEKENIEAEIEAKRGLLE